MAQMFSWKHYVLKTCEPMGKIVSRKLGKEKHLNFNKKNISLCSIANIVIGAAGKLH
jgi:hypothetical protein